jgi:hypothetical protein
LEFSAICIKLVGRFLSCRKFNISAEDEMSKPYERKEDLFGKRRFKFDAKLGLQRGFRCGRDEIHFPAHSMQNCCGSLTHSYPSGTAISFAGVKAAEVIYQCWSYTDPHAPICLYRVVFNN